MESPASPRIRRARPDDLPMIGALGLKLGRQHVAYDNARFTLPQPPDTAFESFFREQLSLSQTAITVAEMEGEIVGYVFVGLEPESIVALLGPTAWIHDIYIEEAARGLGIGRALLDAAIASAGALGSRSLMLGVSPMNTRAREIFEEYGFRLTMYEMRMEL